jgi:hypothetical protein
MLANYHGFCKDFSVSKIVMGQQYVIITVLIEFIEKHGRPCSTNMIVSPSNIAMTTFGENLVQKPY